MGEDASNPHENGGPREEGGLVAWRGGAPYLGGKEEKDLDEKLWVGDREGRKQLDCK